MVIWLPYGLAIISVFYRFKYWPLLVALTFVLAFYFQRISMLAIIVCVVLLALPTVAKQLASRYQFFIQSLGALSTLALALHLIPGFDNLLILNKVITGSESTNFTLYLNLDKPFGFFILFLLMPNMLISTKNRALSPREKTILLSSFTSLFILALLLKLVRFEWSFPDWWWIFAINNALFTCVAEEAFFRGFLQNHLKTIIPNAKFNAAIAIVCSSLLFGLAHFPGGINFIMVATLAGLIYGLSYHWSGRLSIAIAMHFTFNMCHLLFLTYPLTR